MHEDLLSLEPKPHWNRREFVVTTLAAGFALAVQPVSAETITTDAKGLEAGEVKIPVKDGEIPAYRAMPAERRPVPGRPRRAGDLRRPRAHQGRLPPLRQARLPGRRPGAVRPRRATCRSSPTSRRSSPRSSRRCPTRRSCPTSTPTVAWAKKTGKGDTAKLGITGFCWGGRIVWLYAAHNKDLKAGVAWYGRLVGKRRRAAPEAPDRPGRRRSRPRSSASTAAADTGIPVETVEQMREGAQGGEEDGGDHRLPRHAARLPRRLPAQLPQGARPRTAGSGCWRGSRSTAWRSPICWRELAGWWNKPGP